MERDPFLPPESIDKPDKTGESDASKKKKKRSTRVPLPVTKEETAKDKNTDKKPESTLEKLFSQKEEAVKETTESEQAKKTGEELLDTENDADTVKAEKSHESSTIEGEFTEDSLIITRAEQPAEEPETDKAVYHTQKSRKPVPEAPESSEAIKSAPKEQNPPSELPIESDEGLQRNPAPEMPPPFVIPMPAELLRKEVTSESPEAVPESIIEQDTPSEPETQTENIAVTRRRIMDIPVMERLSRFRGSPERKEKTVTRQELEDEVHYARKRGVSRGVVAGGFAGWLLGRRGRKAAEQQAEQAGRRQEQAIGQLKSEQTLTAERISRLKGSEAELARQVELSRQEAPLQTGVERLQVAPYERAAQPVTSERPTDNKPEQTPTARTEKLPEDTPITEQTYKAPTGRRVETSAWHRVEVDEKTGKVIENPEVAYGHEFQQEQRQERLHQQTNQPQVAAQLGQTILTQSDEIQTTNAPSPTKQKNSEETKRTALVLLPEIKEQLVRYTTSPLIWVAAFMLVLLLFLAGVLS